MMKMFSLNACAFLCLSISSYAETRLVNSGVAGVQQEASKEISLREALSRISKEFGIKFTFERAVVDKIKVRYNWDNIKTQKPGEVVEAILTASGLTYKAIPGNYYIITRNKIAGTSVNAVPESITQDALQPVSLITQDTVVNPKNTVKASVALKGTISEKETLKPIEGASVSVVEYGLFTISDSKGSFTFNKVPEGKVTLLIQSVSMVSFSKEVWLEKGKVNYVNAQLNANILSLKDIEVVAKENKTGPTSSTISRKAIEHLQATNLGEVLQLLPGAITTNPDFTNVNKTSIRQYAGDNTGSLGTAVIINGAPLSNNANLQAMNTATAGVLSNFSTSSGMGADMRQLSADNIESIEVIRGIPSVEYGDLTAGAILVKTKAGKEPAQLKARLNPKLTQFWLGKGFDLGKNKGALYTDIDYTKAYDKQISAYNAFDRITSSVQYTNTFGKSRPLFTNTSLSFAMNLDETKIDPDFITDQVIRKAQDYAYRFSTTGKWNLGKKFARSINYTLSASYTHQKGFQQQYYTSDISPVSTAKENTTVEVDYLTSRYLNQLWIDGKPLNVFARLSDNFYAKSGIFTHSFLIGADWKLDANFGAGKTFDENVPPRTSDNAGIRVRTFNDIPSLNQAGFYAEDKITAQLGNHDFTLQAGLRYDLIQPLTGNSKAVVAPRINASYELVDNFYLRAGYGITAKSPTLLYLYPENAYFDMISLNYYKDNPAERMALMTTRVFSSENPDLKIAKTTKNEIGFDWSFSPKRRLSVTAYYEQTRNGYEMTQNLNSIQFTTIPKYTVTSAPAGQKPVLSPIVKDSLWVLTYNSPANSRHIINKGIEFDLDLGRFDQLRTSFVLNGAYISTRSTSSDPYILSQQVANKPLTRLGVYGTERGTLSERLATTLRAIHNLPELRFVITVSAQTIWADKDRYLNYMSVPTAYIPVTTTGQKAQIIEFTKAEREAITPADRDLYLSLNEGYFKTESWKPLWLFNLKLTKEFAKNMSFSFYVNNVFSHQPLQASKRYPTEYEKRNIELFFGSEISIKF